MNNIGNYKVEKYSLFHKLIAEGQYHLLKKHYIKGIFEIDITDCRKSIKKYRSEKQKNLSFSAFIIKCIGTAIEEDKSVQALRKNDTLIAFDDIDLSLTMEVKIDKKRYPKNYIIRKINEKSLEQINDEIENTKKQSKENIEKSFAEDPNYKTIRFLFLLPKFIRNIIWKKIANDPFRIKKMLGTVGFTSIAMFVKTSGWAIPTRSFFSIHFILGSISKKTVMINNGIENREFLSISVMFDHDVVDGGPAARLISKFSRLLEKGV